MRSNTDGRNRQVPEEKSTKLVPKASFQADPDDFIIVIMGPTGAGKTNFINKLTGANAEHRHAGALESDTQSVTPHPIAYLDFRLVLLDTPGFDDTYRSDVVTLRVIANWLVQKYPDGTTLRIAGIIYLHRISDNRMTGSVYKNLQLFGGLCGNINLDRTRLVTTMWDDAKDRAAADNRETELTDKFWRQLIDEGALARRFYNSSSSAQAIVEDLLCMGNDGHELLLQEELVEQEKRLNETEAGKILYTQLLQLLSHQKKVRKKLMDEENDDITDIQLRKTIEQIKAMKIPLPRRIIIWLFGRKSRTQAVKLDYSLA